VQDTAAFLVAYQVEHIFFIVIVETYQVFCFGIRTAEVLLHFVEVLKPGFIGSVFVFQPQVLAVVGKAFIYGKVAPALSGNQVAEPLVKKFMGDGAFPGILVNQFPCILLCAFRCSVAVVFSMAPLT
jgi:hypothetical protein